jgi:hypothetical protein
MSTSTDAIICFGVELYEGDCAGIDDFWDQDNWLRQTFGTQLLRVIKHCSGDEPEYIVAIIGTVVTAARGYPSTFDIQEMSKHITQEALDELRKISDRDPKWLLCSYWG